MEQVFLSYRTGSSRCGAEVTERRDRNISYATHLRSGLNAAGTKFENTSLSAGV